MSFVKNRQIWQIEAIWLTINIEIKVSFIINIYFQVEIRDRPLMISCIFIFELAAVVHLFRHLHGLLDTFMFEIHILIIVIN